MGFSILSLPRIENEAFGTPGKMRGIQAIRADLSVVTRNRDFLIMSCRLRRKDVMVLFYKMGRL